MLKWGEKNKNQSTAINNKRGRKEHKKGWKQRKTI